MIKHYQSKQVESRTKGTKEVVKKKSSELFCVRKNTLIFLYQLIMQLNFAKYERSGWFGYKMVPPGKIQVLGFTSSNIYQEVITKGAHGLGLTKSK